MKSRRASLSKKILTGIFVGNVAIALVTGAVQYRTMRAQMRDGLRTAADNVAETIESIIAEQPALLGSETLQHAVQRFSTEVPDVETVSIVDPQLRIIGNTDPRRVGKQSADSGLTPFLEESTQRWFYYEHDGRKYLRLVHALDGPYDAKRKSAVPAELVIDMRVTPVEDRFVRNILGSMWIVFGLLSLAGAASYWHARRSVINPLVRLAEVADQFGISGDAPVVDIRTGDELETLATAFNLSVQERRKSEERLRAKVVAEESSRAKSEFLANMSHEIRTPMNGVLGMLELALDGEMSPEQREYVATARGSAESLIDIINDILDFSKIEAGRFNLDPLPFRLGDSISDTISTLGLRADQKGIEFLLDIDPDVPDALVGDAGRLRQVVVNLVGNAIKFTEIGEVILHISVARSGLDSTTLRFTVTDTGIGIEKEQQQRVFDAFQQADSSTTRRFGGTGLGLTISSRLVSMMSGQLSLSSTPGVGSVFSFTANFGVHKDHPVQIPETRLTGLRVLAVDDNATNLRILDGMLRSWRMSPTLAASSDEALAILRDAQAANISFSLIITDTVMPGMDGFELVEHIRKMLSESCPTILMLSSAGDTNGAQRSRALGISTYLTKPVRRAALSGAIRSALAGKSFGGSRAALKPSKAPGGRRGLRILIAEDNAVNQKLAASIVTRAGHTATVVGNGLQAVRATERQAFDVILMDVQMPVMGGFEATKRIRELQEVAGVRVPIIAVTAGAMKAEREACLAAGMDDFVTKPVSFGELLASIDRLVGGSSAPYTSNDLTRNGEETFGEARLLEIVQGDRALAVELSQIFLGELEPRMQDIRESIRSGDAQQLQSTAHALKGSAGTVSGGRVAGVALSLEMLGGTGNTEGADALFSELESAGADLRAHLTAFAAID